MRGRRKAFTLVELLVVIGIIALLIAILLPAFSHARQIAQRTACSAKLHQMIIAAQLHRSDHRDYYPLVGIVPGVQPQNLNDLDASIYDYLNNRSTAMPRMLAGITDALAVEMRYQDQMMATTTQAVTLMSDPKGYLQNFLCPSQAANFDEIVRQTPTSYPSEYYCYAPGLSPDNTQTSSEPQSYIYNEGIMGWYDPMNRLRGKASLIRQAASTMFAADGVHGTLGAEAPNCMTYTLYNKNATKRPITMGDAFNGDTLAGDSACFDKTRHAKNMINVAFCDGHVESRDLSFKDLNKIYLLAP